MRLIGKGGEDTTEFEAIYETYFHDVYRYAIALCGRRELAEDITSETFLRSMEALDRFRGDCDIRVWLCQIAKHCYYSHMRKNRRLSFTGDAPLQPPQPSPEERLYTREASRQARAALRQLAEPYRGVFFLRVFGSLSFRQIAESYGKTPNWACVTYHRARKKIQDRMEETT